MAQDYIINSTTLDYIMVGEWREVVESSVLDGQTVHNRWREHVWQTEVMPVTDFDTLYALEGQKVTLTTVDYSDRNNDYVIYYGAEFKRITARHQALNMAQLQCEFMVRL